MRELPERDDKIYKEIEEFQDYELTQCIAYEMAVRSPQNLSLIEKIISAYRENKLEFDLYLNTENNKELNLFNVVGLMLKLSPFIILDIFGDDVEYIEERFGHEFVTCQLLYKKNERQNNTGMTISYDDEEETVTIKEDHQREGYKLIHILSTSEDKIKTQEEIKEHIGIDGGGAFYESKSKIIASFRRPKIQTDHLDTLDTDYDINLNRPLNELIAEITHIKNDMNKNNLMKSPIELLGESLEKTSTKMTTKRLADKFFVYDYVKARLNEIDEMNSDIKKEHDIEEQHIKNNPCLDGTDRATQINMLKKDLRENKINTDIKEIFKEAELTISIPKGTVSRYYYQIKPFIDNMKYKELITGIHM